MSGPEANASIMAGAFDANGNPIPGIQVRSEGFIPALFAITGVDGTASLEWFGPNHGSRSFGGFLVFHDPNGIWADDETDPFSSISGNDLTVHWVTLEKR